MEPDDDVSRADAVIDLINTVGHGERSGARPTHDGSDLIGECLRDDANGSANWDDHVSSGQFPGFRCENEESVILGADGGIMINNEARRSRKKKERRKQQPPPPEIHLTLARETHS